jgi:hypothetical protein
MLDVYFWVLEDGPPLWQAVVPDHPEVNATTEVRDDPDKYWLTDYIVQAYNREVAPEPAVTAADFALVERPEGWSPPGAADAARRAEEDVTVFTFDRDTELTRPGGAS